MASRYIGKKEMCRLVGKGPVALWRLWKNGDFPPPHKTKSGVFLGWPEHEFTDWQQNNKAR